MILCRFRSLCVLESWERRVCWTGVRWGETLAGRHTRGGSGLGGSDSCPLWDTQEADGLVYAYILIWVAKNWGRSATGFEGVFLGFYIYISQKNS